MKYACCYDKSSDPKWFLVYPTDLDCGFIGNEYECIVIVEAKNVPDALAAAQRIYGDIRW